MGHVACDLPGGEEDRGLRVCKSAMPEHPPRRSRQAGKAVIATANNVAGGKGPGGRRVVGGIYQWHRETARR